MSQFRALTVQSGITTQIQPTNELLVGQGIDNDSAGALTIGSTTATSIALAQNTSISGSKTFSTGSGTVTINGATLFAGIATTSNGAASFDLSGGSGIFKTSTGAVTIGPGVTTISGVTTFTAAGTALTVNNNATITGTTTLTNNLTQSNGAVSLHANAASDYTTSVGALTFTSAAATTWSTTAGALSISGFTGLNFQKNASTYLDVGVTSNNVITVASGITLQATGTGQVIATSSATSTVVNVTGLTAAGFTAGNIGYVSANNTLSKAKSDGVATNSFKFFGIAPSANPTITSVVNGATSLQFVASLTLSAGDTVYISDVTAGQATNVPPSTAGHYVSPIGIVLDASTYTGVAGDLTNVLIQPSAPILL